MSKNPKNDLEVDLINDFQMHFTNAYSYLMGEQIELDRLTRAVENLGPPGQKWHMVATSLELAGLCARAVDQLDPEIQRTV